VGQKAKFSLRAKCFPLFSQQRTIVIACRKSIKAALTAAIRTEINLLELPPDPPAKPAPRSISSPAIELYA
jgi:hypothetical protein